MLTNLARWLSGQTLPKSRRNSRKKKRALDAVLHLESLEERVVYAVTAVNDLYNVNENGGINIPAATGVTLNDPSTGIKVVLTNTIPGSGSFTGVGLDGSFSWVETGNFESLSVGQSANVTFTYGVMEIANFGPVVLAPFGPGGTYNAYMFDTTLRTFDQARQFASQQFLQLTPTSGIAQGHVVAVTTAAENTWVQNYAVAANQTIWLGLTDATGTSTLDSFNYANLGTAEFGNTGASALPPLGSTPSNTPGTQRGEGYVWLSGEPLVFQNWAAGEPNDGGNNEDAVEITTAGLWNDIGQGSTLSAGANTTRRTLVEFELGLANLNSLFTSGFVVREVKPSATFNGGLMTGVTTGAGPADTLLALPPASPQVLSSMDRIASIIDFSGDGTTGTFGYNQAFANRDHFALQADGWVYIPTAGQVTFRTTSDDGAGFEVFGAGVTLQSVTNGTLVGNRMVANAVADMFGVYNIPQAGFYQVRLVMHEATGGNHIELSSAIGATTTAANFRLVGDINNGGWGVVTRQPTVADVQSSATVTLRVNGQNDTPSVTNNGGPYAVSEGNAVNLVATATDVDAADILTYSWDLNGDGTFGDFVTTAAAASVSWAQLQAIAANPITDGTPGGVVFANVRVRVTDGQGGTATSAATTLTVTNTAPQAQILAPTTAVVGQPTPITFNANDPSSTDTAAGFAMSYDFGDGSPVVNLPAGSASPIALNHTYLTAGTFTLSFTATDKDGASTTVTQMITIAKSGVIADPNRPGQQSIVLGGSAGTDTITITQLSNGSVRVQSTFSGLQTFTRGTGAGQISAGGGIYVYAGGGNDKVTLDKTVKYGATIYGGDGNDTLTGGAGSDMLLGEAGNDNLYGGWDGRDILLGGLGADTLVGHDAKNRAPAVTDAGDILMGGDSVFESPSRQAELFALYFEWTSARTYAARVANIQTQLVTLPAVGNDGSVDRITGGPGKNLFFLRAGDISNRKTTETTL